MTETQVQHYEAALQIAHSVKTEHDAFLTQVKELKEKNPIFAAALAEYGGMETFHNFRFQCFDKHAVGMGKERLFGDIGIGGYLEANKDKVVLEEFNVIEVEVKNRFQEIIKQLTAIDDSKTAKDVIKNLHGTLILNAVNAMPALS